MNYNDFFTMKHIAFQQGLNDDEFFKIEDIYKVVFPDELKRVLKQALPTSEGFINWRDFSEKNIKHIMHVINRPFTDFYNDASEVYWNYDWGEEPRNKKEIENVVRSKLIGAPRLIPIYGHRYIPMIKGDNVPVFSVCGIDVIYYGERMDDYLEIEFGEKKHNMIDFSNIKYVPFWSEVI